jgi:hypothetical protein
MFFERSSRGMALGYDRMRVSGLNLAHPIPDDSTRVSTLPTEQLSYSQTNLTHFRICPPLTAPKPADLIARFRRSRICCNSKLSRESTYGNEVSCTRNALRRLTPKDNTKRLSRSSVPRLNLCVDLLLARRSFVHLCSTVAVCIGAMTRSGFSNETPPSTT